MKTGLLHAAVVVCLSAPALALAADPVPVTVADKSCPLTLRSARIAGTGERTLQIGFTILNPHRKTADTVIVAAAAVNETGRVRALQTRPLMQRLKPRGTAEYVAEFQPIALEPGERLVVGIQGVMWDERLVWQGALPLARAPGSPDGMPVPKPRGVLQ